MGVRRGRGQRALGAVVAMIAFGVLFPTPTVAEEVREAASDLLPTEVDLGDPVPDDGAEDEAAAMGTEADGDDTGAGDPMPPLPEVPGANPPAADPDTDVLAHVEQPEDVAALSETSRAPPEEESEVAPGAEEVVDERTATTRTFDNGDGSFTQELHTEPIHVRVDGEWEEIDTDLESEDGELVNGPAEVDLTLAEDASDDELVEIGLGDGATIAYGLEGAADVEPDVDGAVATYEDALPGVDLELESTPRGLKETIVLASADVPASFRFPLELDGLTATLEVDGGIAFRDDDDEVVAVVPPGFMVDSGPGEGVRSDDVAYALESEEGQTVLVVTPDRAWLQDPARVWPVRVDPTVERSAFETTYVKQGSSADRSGHAEMRVGMEGGALTAAYMKFFLNIGADHYVTAATLSAWNSYSVGGCTPKPVGVYRVTESWTPSGLQTWPGAAYASTPVDTRSFAHGGGAGCPASWAQFNVRSLVQGWVHGNYPNSGLSLRVPAPTNAEAAAGKRFTAGSTSKLSVTYTPYGAALNPGENWNSGIDTRFNRTGKWPMQVRNEGSVTWPAGGSVRLGYHMYYAGTWTEVPNSATRTLLPEAVSPGELIPMVANIRAVPPGDYDVVWDMVNEGQFWFGDQGSPRVATRIRVNAYRPELTSYGPNYGDWFWGSKPTLWVTGEDPDGHPGNALEYYFRVCPGPRCRPASRRPSRTARTPGGRRRRRGHRPTPCRGTTRRSTGGPSSGTATRCRRPSPNRPWSW